MFTLLFSSVLAASLALLFYQKLYHPFYWVDLRYYLKLRMYKKSLNARMKQGIITYLDCFLLQTSRNPNKPFILFKNQRLTYQDVDRRSNQFANAFRESSLKQGSIVALLMYNHPDFVCVWLGLSKLGCEVAFLNTNIKAKSLLRCIESCGAKTLVVGRGLDHLVEPVLPDLQKDNISVCVMHHSPISEGLISLLNKVENMSTGNKSGPPNVNIMSNFLFIFTSGTTGFPKAARVGHLKAIMSMAFFQMCGATSDDIVYITLPLYHMSASLLGIGGCIQLGATCVLRKKFSATQFWKDCVKYNVTVVQYIGELCRYLVNHAVVPEENSHSVWLAAGSGLRSDVWKEFAERFHTLKVREGYGLTEASIGFLNYTDEIGPIGRASYFNKLTVPFELLRYDTQTYEPFRTVSGRCVRAHIGEVGILVAPVTAMNQFLGYAGNKVQSEKKLIKDVFVTGDLYFNTGDLLLQDHRGFLYFRDRIGDTFRWKGENVSTMEVSEVLCLLDFIQEANVYGVTVPGYEGRAGMAAIVLKHEHKLHGPKLYYHLVETLPAYAWPWFLRIQPSLDVTETFKQQKVKLVQEGFNPKITKDRMYFLDITQKDYLLLNVSLYEDIVDGKIKL
ncbi:long-chain fatty acid transport protein 6 isoform X1 [Syngnathus acus]|uniref:long-chain fatty acid transport protein 6 isoform X1 n=2 Tax=Syngnathus acus TaxID=161584 RepID=UPI00188634BD|nr:long-chain fatty acid transport protein 6 isoform X1 [Syngnathus acus]